MNSKEGQDTHNGTLKPAKPLRASKDPLSQTQGGYRTKSFHQVLSFKHLPCFKKKNYQEHMYWSIWTHARPETKEQKAMGRAAGLQGPELTAWFSA